VLRAERSSYHYRGSRADQANLKNRIREIAETRVRYGYRRIHVLLRREGWDVNGKRVYRLYKELGIQLRRKPPKRRVKGKLRDGRCAASCSNEVWTMDFVHDQLATGSKLRILAVVDTFSWFSPAVVPRFRLRAPDVIEVLERVCSEVGYPASIRVDQGSEFISRDLD
jgi:putative transposase